MKNDLIILNFLLLFLFILHDSKCISKLLYQKLFNTTRKGDEAGNKKRQKTRGERVFVLLKSC